MLWLNPREVALGALTLTDISAIALNLKAQRTVIEHSDLGPHVVFADVAERRSEFEIVQRPSVHGATLPALGDQLALAFTIGPTAAESGRTRIQATVVVMEVLHELDVKVGAKRIIRAVAISPDGAMNPVTETLVD